jgi:hypothetical protein
MNFLINEKTYSLLTKDRIEKCFTNILKDYKNPLYSKDLEKLLKTEFNLENVTVRIIKIENPNVCFFGARIFPSKQELEDIAVEVVELVKENKEEFIYLKKCENIIIEIDSRCFTEDLKLTARELTAMILHEIGHKVYLSESLKVYYKNIIQNQTIKTLLLSSFFVLPVSVINCGIILSIIMFFNSIYKKKVYVDVEGFADKLVVEYGYGVELDSLFTKIYTRYQKQDTHTIFLFLKWIFGKDSFILRKKNIIKILEKELKNTESIYEKEIIEEQLKILRRKGNVMDNKV